MLKMIKLVATHSEVLLMENIVRWLAQTHLCVKIYDLKASEFISVCIY